MKIERRVRIACVRTDGAERVTEHVEGLGLDGVASGVGDDERVARYVQGNMGGEGRPGGGEAFIGAEGAPEDIEVDGGGRVGVGVAWDDTPLRGRWMER